MGDVKAWILGICFAGLACAILDMVYPSGNMEKSMKLVTAVFFLCAVVIPAANRFGDFDLELARQASAGVSAPERLETELNRQIQKVAETNMEAALRNLLRERFSVEPAEILVTMDMRQDGSIEMKCIEILLTEADKEKQTEIKSYVYEQIGLAPEMYVA